MPLTKSVAGKEVSCDTNEAVVKATEESVLPVSLDRLGLVHHHELLGAILLLLLLLGVLLLRILLLRVLLLPVLLLTVLLRKAPRTTLRTVHVHCTTAERKTESFRNRRQRERERQDRDKRETHRKKDREWETYRQTSRQ